MEAYLGLLMLIGRYCFLALLYWYIYALFRQIWRELRPEPEERGRTFESRAASLSFAPAGQVATQPPVISPPPVGPPPAAPAATLTPPLADVSEPVENAVSPTDEAMPTRLPEKAPQPVLVVVDPGRSALRGGERWPLTAAVTIGRAPDNSLVIPDRHCSQHHAIIFLQQGQRILRDRNSTNGTFLNGRRVTGDAVLKPGDQIMIGTVRLAYEVVD